MRKSTRHLVLVAFIAGASLVFPPLAHVQTSAFSNAQIARVVGFDFDRDSNAFVAACGSWQGTLRVDRTRGDVTSYHCSLPAHQDAQCNRPSIGYVDADFNEQFATSIRQGGTCGPRQAIFDQEVARVTAILGAATLGGSPVTRATWQGVGVRCTTNIAPGDPTSQTLISTGCVRGGAH